MKLQKQARSGPAVALGSLSNPRPRQDFIILKRGSGDGPGVSPQFSHTVKTHLWSRKGTGLACVHPRMVAQGVPGWRAPLWWCREHGLPALSNIQAPKQHLEKQLALALSSPLGQAPRILPSPFLQQEKAVQQLRSFPDAFYLFCFIFEHLSAGRLGLTTQSWQEQCILLAESCSSATSTYCSSAG